MSVEAPFRLNLMTARRRLFPGEHLVYESTDVSISLINGIYSWTFGNPESYFEYDFINGDERRHTRNSFETLWKRAVLCQQIKTAQHASCA